MTPSRILSRRRLLGTAATAVAAAALPAAWAQDGRPIEWVVGFAPGGGSDTVARVLAEPIGKSLGRVIIVVNKPGAATNVAAEYAAHARDPGSTLLTADFATLATNPFLYRKLSYNAERDFTSVGMLVRFPLVLVTRPDALYKTFQEFTAWARNQPQGVSYGSPGAGTPHHLATELLRQRTGLKLVHVPYRGAAPAVQDVLGGQLPFMFVETASGLPFIQGGKLRPIAVASARRLQFLPEVPTLQEQGLSNFEAFAWQGLAVPAAVPQDAVARLNKALVAGLESPQVQARFQALGIEGMPTSAAEMNRFAQAEKARWGALIKEIGLQLD